MNWLCCGEAGMREPAHRGGSTKACKGLPFSLASRLANLYVNIKDEASWP